MINTNSSFLPQTSWTLFYPNSIGGWFRLFFFSWPPSSLLPILLALLAFSLGSLPSSGTIYISSSCLHLLECLYVWCCINIPPSADMPVYLWSLFLAWSVCSFSVGTGQGQDLEEELGWAGWRKEERRKEGRQAEEKAGTVSRHAGATGMGVWAFHVISCLILLSLYASCLLHSVLCSVPPF